MDNVLTHKGYFSIVKYSPESEIFYGKIEAIVDLVTYEGETAKEVKQLSKRQSRATWKLALK
jgi:predicted HicB family RNase H-like nuclease